MNPLRTRLVRDMLPVVIVALATVGALSLGMTAGGAWMAGHFWMTNSARTLPDLVDGALAEELLEAYRLAQTWPDRAELRPDQGLLVRSAEGRSTFHLDPTLAAAVEQMDFGSHLFTAGGRAWAVSVAPSTTEAG
jgi:hypothetical protein